MIAKSQIMIARAQIVIAKSQKVIARSQIVITKSQIVMVKENVLEDDDGMACIWDRCFRRLNDGCQKQILGRSREKK